MLGLIPVVLLVATVCGGFYYWLSRRGLAAEERANPQDRRRVSLMTESVAYFGSTLVLAGGGVAVGQVWGEFTDWGHVGIFAITALFFLAIGLVVLGTSEPAIERMIGVVWFVSACCAGTAAAIAAHDVFGASGAVTALITGSAITVYSAMLWLVRRHELQLVALFAGLTITVCAAIITIAGSTGPRLAVALGLWSFGIGWVVVGWQYPQPLWSTMPLATAIALIGPGIAVWSHGWIFAIGIMTAAAAMAASNGVRNTTLLVAGTLTLFGYASAMVIRYYHQSLGLPATLTVCGVLLLVVAVIMARVRRGTGRELIEPRAFEQEPIKPEPLEPEPIEPEPENEHAPGNAAIGHAAVGGATNGHARPDLTESPTLHLPKAS